MFIIVLAAVNVGNAAWNRW